MPKSSESKFLEKVSVKSFALSDAEDNTFVKWKTYSRFIFVQNTISNSPEVSRAKFLESNFVLFLHNFFFFFFFFLPDASLAASRILLKRLLACLNFTLEPEDLSFWYKRKKWFLWTMKPAQAAENHGDQWGLTWYFLSGLYTSTAEALSLKISSHRTALKWPWRPSQSALQYS